MYYCALKRVKISDSYRIEVPQNGAGMYMVYPGSDAMAHEGVMNSLARTMKRPITRTCIGCTTWFFWHLHDRTGTKHSLVELAHEGEDISKRHVGSTLSRIGCVFPLRPYVQQLMTRLKIALQSRPRFLQEGTHITSLPTYASMYTNIQSSGKQNNMQWNNLRTYKYTSETSKPKYRCVHYRIYPGALVSQVSVRGCFDSLVKN